MTPQLTRRMRVRRTQLGLLVAEHPPVAALAWVDLGRTPVIAPDGAFARGGLVLRQAMESVLSRGFAVFPAAGESAEPPASAETPRDSAAVLREQQEFEARRSPQPREWLNVYRSVTGLRWRCCHNLFEEEHSPWCPRLEGEQRIGRSSPWD